MRLITLLVTLSLCAAAPTRGAAASTARDGWSLSSAVKAVALGGDGVLPSSALRESLAAVPDHDLFWVRAVPPAVEGPAQENKLSAATLLKQGFQRMAATARSLGRELERQKFGAPDSTLLLESSDLSPLLAPDQRAALAAMIARNSRVRSMLLADSGRLMPAVAAIDVSPETVVEQFVRNRTKPRQRTLARYNLILAGYAGAEDEVLKGSSRLSSLRSQTTLDDLISAQIRGREELRVADVAGGYGRALRELTPPEGGYRLRRTLVDLFEWQKLAPVGGMPEATDPRNTFSVRLADAARVRFADYEKQDLIVMIEALWYAPDKLATIANLYNQLADGGLLVVASRAPWSTDLTTPRNKFSIFKRFLSVLEQAGIEFLAVGSDLMGPDRVAYHALWLRKSPGTTMASRALLTSSLLDSGGMSTSVYDAFYAEHRPVVISREGSTP
jgi:SAM-dependent methyltransferase